MLAIYLALFKMGERWAAWILETKKEREEVAKVIQTSLFMMKKAIKSDAELISSGTGKETDVERKALLDAIKNSSKLLKNVAKARLEVILDAESLTEVLATKAAPPRGYAEALKAKKPERKDAYKVVTDATLKSARYVSEHAGIHQVLEDVEAIIKKSEADQAEGEISEMFTQVDPAIRFKCGVTCKTFVDPQRLAGCGHTFSKSALLSILRSAKLAAVKCPKSGCNKSFKETDLIPDEELAADVARYNLEQSGASGAGKKRKHGKDEGEAIDEYDEIDFL